MRVCPKCHRPCAHDECYAGYAQCKSCVKARVNAYRARNIEAVRAYDRERAAKPHRVALRSTITVRWRSSHPERYKAHMAVSHALRVGRMTRPAHCEACRRPGRVEAHHADYSRPLAVVWVCKPCHYELDSARRAAEVGQ